MDIKISPVETIFIRNSKVIRIVILVALIFLMYAIFFKTDVPDIAVLLIYLAIGTPIAFGIELLSVRRTRRLMEYLTTTLDLDGTLTAADQILAIYKPKQLAYIGAVKYLKGVALCDEGRSTEAKRIATDYIEQAKVVKRPPYFQLFQMHLLLSTIALREEDYDEYKRQANLAKAAYKRCPGNQRRLIEKNRLLAALRESHKIFTSEQYSQKFEQSLLALLKTKNGKEPDNMTKLTVYSNLFHYYETLSMNEQQREYAEKIVELANEQFDIYNQAKDFLENAD